jgi:hypothetical protein
LQTGSLKKPVWQFMSSGMTSSTAQGSSSCKGTYFEDLVGLRPLGACSYYSQPNFGIVDIGEKSVREDSNNGGDDLEKPEYFLMIKTVHHLT